MMIPIAIRLVDGEDNTLYPRSNGVMIDVDAFHVVYNSRDGRI